jgi:phenylalanyl-tRNA synthetase beta chain
MPTLTYDKKELLNLIGRKLSDKELEETINLIKPSVEEITEDEITIEHTADRPDLFGIEGLARAIKSYLEIQPGLRKYSIKDSGLTIKVERVPVRPFIAAAVIKNVKLTDELIKSLMNIQEVLHDGIGRKRRKVAIGVHDLDKISPPITYTHVKKTEKIVPLEFSEEMSLEDVLKKVPKGKEYGHIISKAKLWPVYIDSKGIFSFPPIINSERTKVTKETKHLFIELTGIDKNAVRQVLNIIVTNLAERGADIEFVKLQYEKKSEITPDLTEDVVEVDVEYANKWIGLKLKPKEISHVLRKMGYDVIKVSNKKIEVIIPAYRVDILHSIDVIEDIAIGYGYNKLIPELPNVFTIGKSHPLEKLSENIRNLLVGLGFQEIIRPVLSNPRDQFKKMNLRRKKVVTLLNPVSEEYTCLRISLIPSLLKFLSANKHIDYPQRIFELGDTVKIDEKEETRTKTIRKVAAAISDSRVGFADIKGILDAFLKNLGLSYDLIPIKNRSFIDGRVAQISINNQALGVIGEIHPKVLENWNLEMPVVVFEIEIENL